jgi:hypothetical protein
MPEEPFARRANRIPRMKRGPRIHSSSARRTGTPIRLVSQMPRAQPIPETRRAQGPPAGGRLSRQMQAALGSEVGAA